MTAGTPVRAVAGEGSAVDLDAGGYQRTELDDGLRIVTEKMPYVRSVSLGVWLDVGSRNELAVDNGISHFIEHMLFKGTKKRSALEIARSIESLGGILNAFTSREQTCYWARILDSDVDVAADVLADIICESVFDPEELERERMVILEEIKDVYDTPAEVVHDHFAQAFWDSHPLGRSVMGRPETVGTITRERILDYIEHNYSAGRVVIAATGNIEHDHLVKVSRQLFSFASDGDPQLLEPPSYNQGRRQVIPRDSAQTHVCLGLPSCSFSHPSRYALLLLNSILGEGMASRLFQSLRERHGLAYAVLSKTDFYRDAGVLSCYLGTEAAKATSAVELILKELVDIKRNGVSDEEIQSAKSQLIGNLLLTLEGSYSRMTRVALHELYLRRLIPVDQTVANINAVTGADVSRLASEIFDQEKLTMVALGPVDESLVGQIDWSILE